MIKEVVLRMPMGRLKPHKNVGFKFTLFTSWLVTDLNKITLAELGDLDPEQAMADMLYCAAKWYYFDKGKALPRWLKRDIGKYWMENMPKKHDRTLAEVMQNVAYEVQEVQEKVESESKKK